MALTEVAGQCTNPRCGDLFSVELLPVPAHHAQAQIRAFSGSGDGPRYYRVAPSRSHYFQHGTLHHKCGGILKLFGTLNEVPLMRHTKTVPDVGTRALPAPDSLHSPLYGSDAPGDASHQTQAALIAYYG